MRSVLRKIRGRLTTPRPRRFVAVDFDSRHLRVVQAERVGKSTRVLRLASECIPDDLDTADPQALGRLLAEVLRAMHVRTTPVVMSVPRGQAVLKPIRLPPGARADELAAMVQFQMAKELPFRPEEAVIDFTVERHYDAEQTAAAVEQGTEVLVAAVPVTVVDYYRHVGLSAKVRLQRLGLRPYANHGCVEHCTTVAPGEHVAVVHLTADETEVDVLAGSALAFSRATRTRTPAAPTTDGEPAGRQDEAAAAVTETARSLQSYQSVGGGGTISWIVVAGGTGMEAEVCRRLKSRLGVRCEALDPAGAFGLEGAGNASEFISALGLAIAHGGVEGLPFDFLRPKQPVVKRDLRKLRAAALAAAAVLVVALGAVAAGRHLAARRRQVTDLRQRLKRVRAVNDRVKRLRSRVRALREWADSRPDWLAHWAHLSVLFPPADAVYAAANPGLRADGDVIRFTAHASSSDGIAALMARLRRAGYLPQVDRFFTTDEPRYPYCADFRVRLDPAIAIDLSSLTAPSRPDDDMPPWGTDSRRELSERRRRRGRRR
jgi:Tfp pilus assembly PilM family ATPase